MIPMQDRNVRGGGLIKVLPAQKTSACEADSGYSHSTLKLVQVGKSQPTL
jgi:hypothetical protein